MVKHLFSFFQQIVPCHHHQHRFQNKIKVFPTITTNKLPGLTFSSVRKFMPVLSYSARPSFGTEEAALHQPLLCNEDTDDAVGMPSTTHVQHTDKVALSSPPRSSDSHHTVSIKATYDQDQKADLDFSLPDEHDVLTRRPLTWREAEQRLAHFGKNKIDTEDNNSWVALLWRAFSHPFNYILLALAAVSVATSDFKVSCQATAAINALLSRTSGRLIPCR